MNSVPLEDTVLKLERRTLREELTGAFHHPGLEGRDND
jgi:hypothetical protein